MNGAAVGHLLVRVASLLPSDSRTRHVAISYIPCLL